MIERLAAIQSGWVIVAYRPHRTKKGHWVWRWHRHVTGGLNDAQILSMGFGNLNMTSLHNKKLTPDETIRAMAHPETVFPQEYEGEGLA